MLFRFLISFLAAFVPFVSGHCQTVQIETPSSSASGFVCEYGLVTAFHVTGFRYDYGFPDLDAAIDSTYASDSSYETGSGSPSYLLDRRGHKVDTSVLDTDGSQWIVSTRFYSGESGLPVFSDDGKVCGVVLGNRRVGGRWRGRVLIFEALRKRARMFPLFRGRILKQRSDALLSD